MIAAHRHPDAVVGLQRPTPRLAAGKADQLGSQRLDLSTELINVSALTQFPSLGRFSLT